MNEALYLVWEVIPRIAATITVFVFLSKLGKLVPKKIPLGSLPNKARSRSGSF